MTDAHCIAKKPSNNIDILKIFDVKFTCMSMMSRIRMRSGHKCRPVIMVISIQFELALALFTDSFRVLLLVGGLRR